MNKTEHWKLATSLHQQNRLKDAEEAYRKIIQADPGNVAALHMLGMAQHQQGRTAEALDSLEKALESATDQPALLANTAKVYLDEGIESRALELLQRALQVDENHYGSLYNQALALSRINKTTEALSCIDQLLRLNPQDTSALLLKAGLLLDLEKYRENRVTLRKVLELGSDKTRCLIGIADSYARETNRAGAIRELQNLKPSDIADPELIYRAAQIYQQLGAWLDVIDLLDELLARDPLHTEAWLRKGLAFALIGEPGKAIKDYQQALRLDPSYHQVYSNILGRMQYDSVNSAKDILLAHKKWASRFASNSPALAQTFDNLRSSRRKLVLGWVSPRFDSSLIRRFLPETIAKLPVNEFAHYFYSTRKKSVGNSDCIEKFGLVQLVSELDDTELAELMQKDQIDILIDLTGHNPGNRLVALSRRIAPVQISWLDYFATTGITAMDYWLSDAYLTPRGSDTLFTESLALLPDTRLCYSPPGFKLKPQRTNRSQQEIVFGSFNRLGKIVEEVVLAWVNILHSVDSSRLLLKAYEFRDQRVRDHTRDRFEKAGLSPERLELRSASTYSQLLTEYGDVDIALDTFPFTGCATTCDALWMGVPVISHYGDTVVSRQGLSILNNIGKSPWTAENVVGYQEISIELARQIKTQSFNRNALRKSMLESSLCDTERFGKAFANQLHSFWDSHCDREP